MVIFRFRPEIGGSTRAAYDNEGRSRQSMSRHRTLSTASASYYFLEIRRQRVLTFTSASWTTVLSIVQAVSQASKKIWWAVVGRPSPGGVISHRAMETIPCYASMAAVFMRSIGLVGQYQALDEE